MTGAAKASRPDRGRSRQSTGSGERKGKANLPGREKDLKRGQGKRQGQLQRREARQRVEAERVGR